MAASPLLDIGSEPWQRVMSDAVTPMLTWFSEGRSAAAQQKLSKNCPITRESRGLPDVSISGRPRYSRASLVK